MQQLGPATPRYSSLSPTSTSLSFSLSPSLPLPLFGRSLWLGEAKEGGGALAGGLLQCREEEEGGGGKGEGGDDGLCGDVACLLACLHALATRRHGKVRPEWSEAACETRRVVPGARPLLPTRATSSLAAQPAPRARTPSCDRGRRRGRSEA